MKIKELIDKVKFCSQTEREFVFDDEKKLPYYCCKKTAVKNCSENCNDCKEIYARYVVIDLTNNIIKDIYKENVLESREKFNYFQENYLSEIFFYESDLVRFNIYLIFIINNKQEVEEYMDYSFDLNYARKLFLTPTEFEEYFNYYRKIKQYGAGIKYSMDQEILKELENVVYKLDSKGMKSLLLENTNIIDYFLGGSFHTQNNYDIACKTGGNAKYFIEKYIYKDKIKANKNIRSVRSIKTLKLEKYRQNCFGDTRVFQFGRANIIFGINTAGKTSLLDAIEFAFTGDIHKYKSELSEETRVIVENENGEALSSEDARQYSSELKAIWYPYKIGTLNELFGRINYFDTDATYRFALEQGDTEEAYRHIKNLLSTSRLIDIEHNLKDNLAEISRIKVFLNRDDFYIKGTVSKIRKQTNKRTVLNWFDPLKRKRLKTEYLYRVDKKKVENIMSELNGFQNECQAALIKIQELINSQIMVNINLLNMIFHRLFSLNYDIKWDNNMLKIQNKDTDELVTIEKMSTAQKVSLALSVVFTQFFLAKDAPQFILLDESVVNFDAFHLLNLFDFLREFALNNVQIFFTTASEDIAQIAKSKLGFLGEDCYIYKLTKTAEEESHI